MATETATHALCPECLARLPAVKAARGAEVWLERTCPRHGAIKTKIAKDAGRFFDASSSSAKPRPFTPLTQYAGECGRDCGWCGQHRQHICTGVVEITGACNLDCPVCYFGGKSGAHISLGEFSARLDDLLAIEQGRLDVLQLSGGECLLHPRFSEILDLALARDVGRVVLNTNGLALLDDNALFEKIRRHRDRVEAYLQFDGFDAAACAALRGRSLLAEKRKILEKLNAAEIKICLAVTVCAQNLAEVPEILRFATGLTHVSGVTFQRLTRVGHARGAAPVSVLQEDILLALASSGLLAYKDLQPLPCSHENCTTLAFLFCTPEKTWSVADYVDLRKCRDVLANRLAFDQAVLEYMRKNICDCFAARLLGDQPALRKLREFAEGNASAHNGMKVLRVIVKNFMDPETFDFARVRKCCAGVAVGNRRVVPFCLHNVLKMEGEMR